MGVDLLCGQGKKAGLREQPVSPWAEGIKYIRKPVMTGGLGFCDTYRGQKVLNAEAELGWSQMCPQKVPEGLARLGFYIQLYTGGGGN